MSATYYKPTNIVRPTRLVAGQHLHTPNLGGYVATFLVALLFVAMAVLVGAVPKKPELIVVLAAGLTTTLGIIRWPIISTYLVVILTVIFDVFPNPFVQTPISEMGIFRNLSTRGLPQAVIISIFEIVVFLGLASSLVRQFNHHQKFARGPLFRPLLAFGAVVIVGEVNGILSSGDFKISLYEIRPLLYIPLLYVLAVNTIRGPKQVRIILWLTILATFVRCFEGIYRYFKMPPTVRSVASVVLEHDDSLFLVVAVGMLVAAVLYRRWLPKYMYPMLLLLLPFVLYIMVVNGRRAVFLCVFIMLATFLPLLWVSLRSEAMKRRLLTIVGVSLVVGAIYMVAFWNKEGGIAQPAAAVRSIFQPSERDYLSNLYRDQENANLRYTIGFNPVVGIGFGKPFSMIVPMVDLTADWALQLYMPHNNMLWLWMRMGVVGFITFWVALGAAVVLVAACVRLGVARLRVLASQEVLETKRRQLFLSPSTRGLASGAAALKLVRLRRPDEEIEPRTPSGVSIHMMAEGFSREGQECAEFIVLAYVALATLVSLAGLGVVDQGLMSFRLSAFAGLALGTLASAWNVNSIRFRQPELLNIEKLPLQEETAVVKRRRVRRVARA